MNYILEFELCHKPDSSSIVVVVVFSNLAIYKAPTCTLESVIPSFNSIIIVLVLGLSSQQLKRQDIIFKDDTDFPVIP